MDNGAPDVGALPTRALINGASKLSDIKVVPTAESTVSCIVVASLRNPVRGTTQAADVADTCVSRKCVEMHIDMDMFIDMCIDLCMDMCVDLF